MRLLRSLLLLMFTSAGLWAQPTYNMGNQTVNDCRAFFEDSGTNPDPAAANNYANNENFTFVISNPTATQIILTFQSFCTELIFDVLRVYDGPDTNSLLLGTFTGTTLPPGLVATSGAMTIHFRSDANVTCSGWNAYWYSIVPPPVPPNINQVTASCLTSTIDVVLDAPVHCDSILDSAFVLTGAPLRTIVGAQALNCVNDSTTTFRLTVNSPFSDCATYGLDWNLNMLDECDSLYSFLLNSSFSITDCPLSGSITASDDSICIGECTLLSAAGIGGDCNYTYSWNNGLPPTAGPHQVCPPPSLNSYTVIINDGVGNGPDTLTINVLVTLPPDAGPDTTVCLQSPPFDLQGRVSPAGGVFFGPGITAAAAGTFDPSLAGQPTVAVYYSVNGCADSLLVNVVDVQAGSTQGSCPNGPLLAMTGGVPAGGYWTGPNVDSFGVYTPPAAVGIDTVYYHFAGCAAPKEVYVDSIVMNKIDTICQSSPPYQLVFNPPGGTWFGVALLDSQLGILDPQLTLPGDHVLIYDLNGCRDSLRLHIKAIQAGANLTRCPLGAPFTLPAASPAGGFWSGPGILDSLTGTFDPGVNGAGNSNVVLFYHQDGCIDSIQISLRRSNLSSDTIARCINGGNLALGFATTGRNPAGGTWSGPGVNPAGNGSFNPTTAGIGYHRLYYTANGCTDSVVLWVQEVPRLQADTVVCISTPAFNVQSSENGGLWRGPGISDSLQSLFQPVLAGVGQHRIYQTFAGACSDSMLITVQAIPVISFSGLDTAYCFRDTLVQVNNTPAGGTLSGPGVVGNQFNPRQAGVGAHWLLYTAGTGDCERADSFRVVVGDSLRLQLTTTADTLCFGETAALIAQLSGGLPGRQLRWVSDGSTADTLRVTPLLSGWYAVEASDGCSDPILDSVYLFVHPPLTYQANQQTVSCFDSLGVFFVNFAPTAPYRVEWLTNPVVEGQTFRAPQGTYRMRITDTITGCQRTDTIEMIAYPPISANFSLNPNRNGCYDLAEANISFIDLSLGGTTGFWDFGNGVTEPYVFGQYPQQLYTDTGRFTVRLVIENGAGCADVAERTLCVFVLPRILVPTAFTPNADLTNDRFKVVTVGINSLEIFMYDRWGRQVFQANTLDFEWDGTKSGAALPNGVYSYIIYYTDFTSIGRRMQAGSVTLIK